MAKDLTYTETADKHTFALVGAADTPELIKRAITLLLFSQDPEIRNFNGRSVVTSFSSLPQTGFAGINFYLTSAAKKLKQILQELDNRVSDVYFECVDSAPSLLITLNIKLADDTLTAVVYNE